MVLHFIFFFYFQSFNDEKQLCKTSIDWGKTHQPGNQDSQYEAIMIQLQEANKEADNTCDFICRSSKIMCHTGKLWRLSVIDFTKKSLQCKIVHEK